MRLGRSIEFIGEEEGEVADLVRALVEETLLLLFAFRISIRLSNLFLMDREKIEDFVGIVLEPVWLN